MSTVRTLAAKKKVHSRAKECPLCVKYGHIPNPETQAAMRELDEGGGEVFYGSTEEFIEYLLKEDD
jgi:hypothetical protein